MNDDQYSENIDEVSIETEDIKKKSKLTKKDIKNKNKFNKTTNIQEWY